MGGHAFCKISLLIVVYFCVLNPLPPTPHPHSLLFCFMFWGFLFGFFRFAWLIFLGEGGGGQFSSRFGISVYKLNSLKIHFCHLNLACMTFWTHKLTCFPQFIPPRLTLIMKWEKRSYFVCIFHDIKNNDSCLLEYVCFELLMVSLVSFPMMEICQNVSIIFSNIP